MSLYTGQENEAALTLAKNPNTLPDALETLWLTVQANLYTEAHLITEALCVNPNISLGLARTLYRAYPLTVIDNPSWELWALENPNFIEEAIEMHSEGGRYPRLVKNPYWAKRLIGEPIKTYSFLGLHSRLNWEIAKFQDASAQTLSHQWPSTLSRYAYDLWEAKFGSKLQFTQMRKWEDTKNWLTNVIQKNQWAQDHNLPYINDLTDLEMIANWNGKGAIDD